MTFELDFEGPVKPSNLTIKEQKVIVLLETSAGVESTEKMRLLLVGSLEIKCTLPHRQDHSSYSAVYLWVHFHGFIILLAGDSLTAEGWQEQELRTNRNPDLKLAMGDICKWAFVFSLGFWLPLVIERIFAREYLLIVSLL